MISGQSLFRDNIHLHCIQCTHLLFCILQQVYFQFSPHCKIKMFVCLKKKKNFFFRSNTQYIFTRLRTKLCPESNILITINPPHFKLLNQAQKNPVVLPSFPVKIWGNLVKGSVMIGRTNKQRLLLNIFVCNNGL